MPRLRLRHLTFDPTPTDPLVMAVLNASPESFSDGREFTTLDHAVARGREAVVSGADLVDVGGESGVTNRAPIAIEEEIRRVVPLVAELVAGGALVSVDTWKRPVARAALEAGAHLINDVSGLRDPGIAEECAACGAGLVVMHTRAAPKLKEFPAYDDVVTDVVRFLAERVEAAVARGLDPERIVVDPGPDFAKTPAQTVEVLQHLDRLAVLGRPVLLALSRKDFVGAITGRMPRQRLGGTLAALGEGLDGGGSVVRVHDVAATVDFLRVRGALRGHRPVPPDLHLAEELRREPAQPARVPTGDQDHSSRGHGNRT